MNDREMLSDIAYAIHEIDAGLARLKSLERAMLEKTSTEPGPWRPSAIIIRLLRTLAKRPEFIGRTYRGALKNLRARGLAEAETLALTETGLALLAEIDATRARKVER